MRRLPLLLLIPALLVVSGCAQTTLRFTEPAGTQMLLGRERVVTWPAEATFPRPAQAGSSTAYPVEVRVPHEGGYVLAGGEIRVFAHAPRGEDRFADYAVSLTPSHLRQLLDGQTVRLMGTSPTGDLVFRMRLEAMRE